MEQQVIVLVNRERSNAGLSSLQRNESLMESCDIRAQELVTRLEHTRPNGSPWNTAIKITYKVAAENIAAGQPSAEVVMSGWMNSPGHRGNILEKDFTHIGVGCYKHENTLYWVQLFIAP